MARFNSWREWYNARLKKPLDQLKANNLPLRIAANSTHAMMADRIFLKGQRSDGATFQYAEGYRETKRRLGRGTGKNTSFVNYTLTGDLKGDFTTGLKMLTSEVFQVEVKRSENLTKIEDLEKKYGGVGASIFVHNEEEKENFLKIIDLEFKRIMGL